MKIVHLVLSSGADYTDNWGYQENTLPEEHVRLGHEVTLVTSTISSLVGSQRETTSGFYFINGVKIIRIKPNISLVENRFCTYPSLFDVLVEEKPDLIFSHGFLMLSLGQLKKYKYRNPHVIIMFDCHSTYVNSMQRMPRINKWLIHKGLWKFIYQKNRKVFKTGYYVAPQVKPFLIEMYNVNEAILDYLPMGVYIPSEVYSEKETIRKLWREKNGIHQNCIVFAVGGRFRESKRLYEAIQAFNQLNDSNTRLLVFGNFESEAYEEKVRQISSERVLFLGWLNTNETRDLYFASDIALFTGTQSVIWRAAVGCGLPAICRYSEGTEELDVGGNCLFINSDEPDEWTNQMKKVIQTEGMLEKMTKVADTEGRLFFSEERIAQKIIDDFNFACKGEKC